MHCQGRHGRWAQIYYYYKKFRFSRTCVKTFTVIPQVSVGAVLGRFNPWSRLKVPKNTVGLWASLKPIGSGVCLAPKRDGTLINFEFLGQIVRPVVDNS